MRGPFQRGIKGGEEGAVRIARDKKRVESTRLDIFNECIHDGERENEGGM